MFINKAKDGKNNICGKQIASYRIKMGISQKKLSDRLQIIGLNIDKNAIQRIESGQRFVTDMELVFLARALDKEISDLLNEDNI